MQDVNVIFQLLFFARWICVYVVSVCKMLDVRCQREGEREGGGESEWYDSSCGKESLRNPGLKNLEIMVMYVR